MSPSTICPPITAISLSLSLSLALASCAATTTADESAAGGAAPGLAAATPQASIQISPQQSAAIGRKIWQNECGGTVEGLTSWNAGEGFASLGIGHFIWYPAGMEGPFDESFPSLVRYLGARGAALPGWLRNTPDCPWNSKAEFERAAASPQMTELRQFLAGTVPLQTSFIVARLEAALPKMLAAAPAGDRARVRAQFYATAETPNGVYALIDYVNFKGEGVKPTERYRGEGWGLLQVLQGMQGSPHGQAAAAEFSASAKRVLARRVENSPPDRGESRWLKGWHRRCDSYAQPFGS